MRLIGNRRRKREKRKLEETSKGKSTRTSEESIYLQREIIDAIRKSEEKMEIYSRKTDEKMDKSLQTITDSVGTQLPCENERTRRQIQANQ